MTVDDPDPDPDPDLGAIDLDIDMIVVEAEIIDDLPDEPDELNGVVDAVIVDDEPAPPPPAAVDSADDDATIAPEAEIDLDDAVIDLDAPPPPAAETLAPRTLDQRHRGRGRCPTGPTPAAGWGVRPGHGGQADPLRRRLQSSRPPPPSRWPRSMICPCLRTRRQQRPHQP